MAELADMFICACGCARFSKCFAMKLFSIVDQIAMEYGMSYFDLEKEVDAKMQINRARTWEKNAEGIYHHI